MAPSIEELDATVRAFYEGRGESVSISQAVADLTVYTRRLLTRWPTAKSCPSCFEPGTSRFCAYPSASSPAYANIQPQFKEDPDAWLLVDRILQEATYPQTKCTRHIFPAAESLHVADKFQIWACKYSTM